MVLPQRLLRAAEQPERLVDGLQNAVVARTTAEAPVPMSLMQRLQTVLGWHKPCLEPVTVRAIAHGVPHGVVNAIVYAKDVRIAYDGPDGSPQIFFCPTHGYVALDESIKNADAGQYPPLSETRISVGCSLPTAGKHDALMLVSVNGSVNVHIKQFGVNIPKVQELATADA